MSAMFAQKQWSTFCLAMLILLTYCGGMVAASDEVVVAGVTIATVTQKSLKIHHDNYEAVKHNHGQYKAGTDLWEGTEFHMQQVKISPDDLYDFIAFSPSFNRFTKRMTPEQRDQFEEALSLAPFALNSANLVRKISIRERERIVAVMLLVTKKDYYGDVDILMSSLHEDACTRFGLEWGKEWHANLQNQRMLEGWATYRLMLKLQDRHEL